MSRLWCDECGEEGELGYVAFCDTCDRAVCGHCVPRHNAKCGRVPEDEE